MSIWFYLFLTTYAGAMLMCVLWLTNGGEVHQGVARWRMVIVTVFWPLALLGGIAEYFLQFMFETR